MKAKEEAEKAAAETKRLEEEEERKKNAEEQAKREEEEAKLDAASAAYRPTTAAQELKGSRNFLTVSTLGMPTTCLSFDATLLGHQKRYHASGQIHQASP